MKTIIYNCTTHCIQLYNSHTNEHWSEFTFLLLGVYCWHFYMKSGGSNQTCIIYRCSKVNGTLPSIVETHKTKHLVYVWLGTPVLIIWSKTAWTNFIIITIPSLCYQVQLLSGRYCFVYINSCKSWCFYLILIALHVYYHFVWMWTVTY